MMDSTAITDIYPLTPVQQGLLFHTLYAPESGMYVEQMSLTLEGPLERSALRRAWQIAVDRHPILRTAFFWEDLDQPTQVVYRQGFLPVQEVDWRDAAPAEQAARLAAHLRAEQTRGFDLSTAPLLRVFVARLSETTYQLVITNHHIILDGWSKALMLKEVLAAYEYLRQNRPLSFPPPRPFREYIAWLKQQDLAAAQHFWQQMLAGVTVPTPLIEDRPPTAWRDLPVAYAQERFTLDAARLAALYRLAQQQRVTLNTIVQAVWALLLSRYSGKPDVLFGITVAGRPLSLAGIETMVGMFINTLPLRIQPAPQRTLPELLRQLQDLQLDLQQFEHSPLSQIQGWSEIPRGTPLFESIVVFENYPVDASLRQMNGSVRVADMRTFEHTNYPLVLVVEPGSDLVLRMIYNHNRFERGTIQRMLEHVATLLRDMVAQPTARLGELTMMPPAEWRELISARNQTSAEYPRRMCFHQLFEAQVQRTPEAIAVRYGEQALSYAALNERANQLAHYLRARAIGPQARVGICVDRSIEMLVGLLGIFKAGGAFVPLDPGFPSERIAYILEDAQVAVVLTQDRLRERLQPEHTRQHAPLFCLDADWSQVTRQSCSNLDSGVAGDSLAYLIYTSGSTGRPKGVLIPHSGLTNYLVWCIDAYTAAAGCGAPVHASIAADAIFPSLFAPLLVGTTVVMLPESSALEALGHALQHQGPFSLVKITPSQLEVLNHQLPKTGAQSWIRTLVVGAEEVRGEVLAFWQEHAPDTILLNEYGPTETVVGCSIYQIPANQALSGSVPIGLPIANTTFYVLDSLLQPVPIGVPGELYIGGDGVAWGYQGRPELTAEKFVPDRFSAAPGSRLYKTGDLVRLLPDREQHIVFLGRIDDQVKIRGYRVEPGEVAEVLMQHPQVREAIVLARKERATLRRLVAYVVAAPAADPQQTERLGNQSQDDSGSDSAAPTVNSLRRYLAERLPEYMVPSAFVFLDAIPLAPHGKIDRSALPAPATTRPDLENSYVAPSTELERILATIWQQVLGVDQVGIHDNFLTLGGDSIRSIQVLARAREHRLPLTLPQLFRHQTLHDLAQVIAATRESLEAETRTEPFSLIPPADRQWLPEDVVDAYPLAQLQAGMIFHSEMHPESVVYHDVFSFHVRTRLDLPALQAALDTLAARHPMLRTSFDLSSYSEPLQLVHRAAQIPVETHDIAALSPAEQSQRLAAALEAEKQRPFSWTRPPLLRIVLHRRSAETFQFTLVEHHAIIDGWSKATVLTELFQIYTALLQESVAPLPPPPAATYRDFVALERQALLSEEARHYWQHKLQGTKLAAIPRRPGHVPSEADPQIRGFEIPIERTLSDQLKRLAQMLSVPLKSVLLAAHAHVISRLSGQQDIVTGLSSNGRPEQRDGDRVMGLFLNNLPFRLTIADGTWQELIRQTFESEMELLPFQRYPMSQIQREQGGRVLYETSFVFTHIHLYTRLHNLPYLEILDAEYYTITHLPLLAFFSLDLNDGAVCLTLKCDMAQFDEQQVGAIGQRYVATLAAMVREPDGAYPPLSPPAPGQPADQQRKAALRQSSLQKLATTKRRKVIDLLSEEGMSHE